jgi:coenzyme F420 hydrogenase subunit beta
LHFVSDAPKKNEALGYYRKIVLAQATDKKLREQSQGGGVAVALLDYGVKNKIFDSTIYSQSDSRNHINAQAPAEVVKDDTLSGVKCKYFTSSVAKAYGKAVFGYTKQKIAYVGIPCHTLALRKMEAWQHKFINNLAISIGLFCFGSFSIDSLIDYITQKYGIQPSEIKHMRLSTDFIVETNNKTINIPISEVDEHLQSSCRTCMDFTAELSDISIGAAYPLDDWSIVIIRTKTGEAYFNDAVANGAIKTDAIENHSAVFEHIVRAAMQKRKSALEAAENMEKAYGYFPILLLREAEALKHVKVEDIMAKEVETVPHNMTISQLLHLMAQHHHIGYPVLGESGEVIGIITLEDASQISKEARDSTLVNQAIHRKPVAVHVGETALDAFKKMSEHEVGRVLVVDKENPKKILGLITKTDLMHTLIRNRC